MGRSPLTGEAIGGQRIDRHSPPWLRGALSLVCLLCCAAGGPAPAAHATPPPLRPREEAIIARVDSLWLAEARDSAHALVRAFIPRARATPDSLFLLHLLARQGQMWAALNLSRPALPVLREALELSTRLRVTDLHGACLRWLGVALYAEGSLEEGLARYRELLELSRACGDVRHEGYAWMGLAYHARYKGEAIEARRMYERAADLLRRSEDLRGELWALIGLNITLSQLGAYRESIAGNRRIVEIGRDAGMRGAEALGHNNLGALLYSLGDPGEALAHFEQAQRIMEDEGDLRESIVAGNNIGVCEIMLGRTQAAMERLGRLLEMSRRERYVDLDAGLLGTLADAYFQEGIYPLAAKLERETLGLGDALSLKHECEALVGLSAALAAMGDSRGGLEVLRSRADRILTQATPAERCRFRIVMARRLMELGRHADAIEALLPVDRSSVELGLAELRLEALPLLARAMREDSRPDSALAYLEKARRLWETDRGMPLDPEWREQRGAVACDLFAQLTAAVLERGPDHPRAERLGEAFMVLQTYKARTLHERMRGPGGGAEPPDSAAPLSLHELQSRVLMPDELLIEALHGPEQTILFACTRNECRVAFAPGGEALAAKLRLQHELLSSPPRMDAEDPMDRAMASRVSRAMTELLCAPFADLIRRQRHVILAPDGALNLVSASILLRSVEPGIDAVDASTPAKVSTVPAASILARLRGPRPAPSRHAGGILVLTASSTDGDSLPGTSREGAWLARRFARVDRGLPRGSLAGDAWQAAMAPYDVLHFAMHSAAEDRAPWMSAIELRGADPATESRRVLASEIAAASLPARLVVLSGCESARGRILSGEGVQGIASAFLAAGARTVLATLWAVDDAVTVGFMEEFYEALADGQDAAGAIERAQSALRSDPRTSHPFYWAGFTLVGDGSLRLDLPRRRPPLWKWGVTAACLIGLAFTLRSVGKPSRGSS